MTKFFYSRTEDVTATLDAPQRSGPALLPFRASAMWLVFHSKSSQPTQTHPSLSCKYNHASPSPPPITCSYVTSLCTGRQALQLPAISFVPAPPPTFLTHRALIGSTPRPPPSAVTTRCFFNSRPPFPDRDRYPDRYPRPQRPILTSETHQNPHPLPVRPPQHLRLEPKATTHAQAYRHLSRHAAMPTLMTVRKDPG
jgi:hypothetical protein